MLKQIIDVIFKLFKWWIIIVPWEQGIRVRLGKRTKLLNSGIYLCIPFIDKVYKQCTRRRLVMLRAQTITTKDGNVLTINGSLGYIISDVMKLYKSLYAPDDSLNSIISSKISEYVFNNNLTDCNPAKIRNYVLNNINITEFGLSNPEIYILNYVRTKTYRLITGEINNWSSYNVLNTQKFEGEHNDK